MKIKKIHFEDHFLFGTKDIDVTDSDGNALDTIVLAGINGSGKTTILTEVKKMLHQCNELEQIYCECEWKQPEKERLQENEKKLKSGRDHFANYYNKYIPPEGEEFRPKIIYLPTEINFNKFEITNQPYFYNYKKLNIIDENITKHIPDYFATLIDKQIYKNENLPAKKSIQMACDEINSVFSEIDLEVEIIGLKKDGSRMPIFQNSLGKTFEIDGLSSGEKQLFFRIMALKMIEANNSIILIDEPEISLHPSWQQKILKLYENVGENNQIFVATHSPHVISSAKKESLRLLVHGEDSIEVLDYNDITSGYGQRIDKILVEIMGLKALREPAIQKKIDELWAMIKSGKYESDEFKEQYEHLEDILGTLDEDLFLMNIEIAKRKSENAKD